MKKGFTLIELLVVVAIIGILSAIVLSSLSDARAKARDTRRKADLNSIKTALFMYHLDNDHYALGADGCGRSGDVASIVAYFNYSGTNWGYYGKSVADCLYEDGYIGSELIDPTGNDGVSIGRPSPTNDRYTYMISSCMEDNSHVAYVYAKMETEPQSTSATNDTCSQALDTGYGMNYWVKIE